MAQQHRLQRLTSPSRSLSLALHIVGIASFAYSFDFLLSWDNFITHAYGWHFQFLTIIGLSSALLTFSLGLLADLTLNQTLFAAKNAVSVISTPLEALVSVMYWGLHVIDPHLVVPKDFQLATHVDIGFHLAPAVLLTLDLLFFSPPWTVSSYGIMSIGAVLAVAYWFWVEQCYAMNGWYPYPFFAMLSTEQRIGLFSFSVVLITLLSSALKVLYGAVNGYDVLPNGSIKPSKKRQ